MVYQDTIIPFSKCQLYTPLFRYTTSNITYTVYGSPACEPYLTVLPDLCRVTVIGIFHKQLLNKIIYYFPFRLTFHGSAFLFPFFYRRPPALSLKTPPFCSLPGSRYR